MVSIAKREIKGQTYYYLEHSFREKGKIMKKQLYLGKTLPKDIEKLKRNFIYEIYRERWFSLFDKIKQNYAKEQKTMPPSAKEKEVEDFATRFTYNSNRIEGSTLTLRETAALLERGISPRERPLRDIKEAESHQKLYYEMREYQKDLTFHAVLFWHKQLFEASKPDIAGKLREHQVAISGSKFMPPSPVEIYSLLKEFFSWYDKNKSKLHPVELAALVHLKFVTIHPFADGNGRMSRLLMNFVLHKHGYPQLIIPYENRTGYYTALERAQIKDNETVFLNWFFKRYAGKI